MAKYSNLPGIEVSIADGGLILPEDQQTQSLLIIGPSTQADAPKEPVLIRQSSDLRANGFGDFVEGGKVNKLSAAWKQAFEGGARRIYLMAMEGTTETERFEFLQSQLFGILTDFPVNHMALVDVFADKEAELTGTPVASEGVKQENVVEGTALVFPLTVAAGTSDVIVIGEETLTLAAKDYASAVELKEELESEIATAGLNLRVSVEDGKVRLSGDDTFKLGAGTTAAGLAAGDATQHLTGNFALLAGQYAESQTLNHNATVAYIGAQAPASNSLTHVKANVDRLAAIINEYTGYLQAVASPELGYILPGRGELYFTNGVVTYAALTCTLRAESATTNKRVYGVAGIHYNLSHRQLNALTGNKFVTFRLKGNQVVVTDGVTTAPDYVMGGVRQTSDFTRLSTLRITQAAAQLVRNLVEPYIGEPNRMPQYNAMNATIKGGLESMKEQGAIFDYRFTVVASGGSLSEATITLELVPAFEMRKVSVNVSLRPPYASN